MSRLPILSILILILYTLITAQNPLPATDSVESGSAVGDVSVVDTSLQDSIYVSKDSMTIDTISSLQGSGESFDSLSKEEGGIDSSGGPLHVDGADQSRPAKEDSLLQRDSVKKIVSKIRNIFRFFLKYFIQFFFLVISCGVIVYTILFFQKRSDDKRFLTSTRLSVMDKQVRIACKYMENNFDNPDLSIETICEDLVTGPAFLEALFERELGMTVSDFLTHIRINRVKEILSKEPDITVEELILRIGYTNVNLFLQHFKEINGIDFQKYQESAKSTNSNDI